ncbi:xylulokinase [Occallatibacter riparius]|uniref:FGGY-family carbohydrate kinase n=1 Tax=Occallatibacter riparius TaxID=1002689 RepID=A0A9J7BII0_9BACT|nr:FGGY-family carbohydrate kinase [Occallatibacter riparius]UWZ82291.1 FGGY-family carbohydrate kinase [Occallatibacter riparius]
MSIVSGPLAWAATDRTDEGRTGAMIAQSGEFVLAVDLGTSGCKCALVAPDGTVNSWAFRPVALHIVDQLGAEQDPEDWWNALVGAAREALSALPAQARVIAVCCSSQGECTVAVDKSGKPLHRAMLWLDMRGAQQIRRRAGSGLLSIAGYEPLRLMRWIHRTGGAPALSGKDPAAHMAFIQETRPEIYEKTYKFLNALDYLNLRLTGRFVATVDSILTSWVTDNRDIANVHYDPKLIRQSGIDADKFPEIVRCTDLLGPLTPEAAQQLGLPQSTPVVAGAVDNSAAALGAGTIVDGETHIYIGTSSWIGAHVPFKKTDLSAQIASVPCALDGRYLATALQSSAGSNLSYLSNKLLFPDDEFGTPQPADFYAVVERIVASSPPGACGLLYTPWIFGERSPVDDSSLRAGLLNLSLHHSRADLIRAVLEGIALNTRWMLSPFIRFLGHPIKQVTLVGGGATSDAWCQIFADVLGVPVRQLVSSIQVNTIGAAFIGHVGLGKMKYNDLTTITRIRRTYTPDPATRNLYDERFEEFQLAYKRLAPFYKRINSKESRPS